MAQKESTNWIGAASMVTAIVGSFLNPLLLDGKSVNLDDIGIDGICVTYPVTDTSTRTHHWDSDKIRSRVAHTASVPTSRDQVSNLGHRGLHVTRTDHPQGTRCRIEVTPSLLLGKPDNTRLLSDGQIRSLVNHAVYDVQSSLGLVPLVPLRDARITRLDIARNLVIDDPGDVARFLRGLAEFLPANSPMTQAFRTANGVTSVKMGGKARSVRVYDKHLESKGAVPEGTVRWEARLRTEALKRLGIGTVGDLDVTALRHARFKMWVWSGMTQSIVQPHSFVTRLEDAFRAGKISLQSATRLAGSLFINPQLASESTRGRNRRQLRILGITPVMGCRRASGAHGTTSLRARYHAGRISRE